MSGKNFIRWRVPLFMLGLSALAWIVLLLKPGHLMKIQHCPVTLKGPSRGSLDMLFAMNPISSLLLGWALMVMAMMLPKIIFPVQYICDRCFKRQRLGMSFNFILGYVLVWMIAGIFILALIFGSNLLMPRSYVPALIATAAAVIWQFSPLKQRCLNRGHQHSTLRAFGLGAYRDALFFGFQHGFWCVGSGWLLMLLPMLLPQGHNLAMVLVSIIMIGEHFENPRLPQWRLRLNKKFAKIVWMQARMGLERVRILTERP